MTIKERPILFSAPMVRAILEGRKMVTRRVSGLNVINAEPDRYEFLGMVSGPGTPHAAFHDKTSGAQVLVRSPYGQPGDRLWVKETFFAWGRWETRYSAKKGRDEWHFIDMTVESDNGYLYAADGVSDTRAFIKRRSAVTPMYWKRPAIFMPRAASRITLEVTGVRVERLQEITGANAIAEGIHTVPIGSGYRDRFSATPVAWADAVEQAAVTHEDPWLAFRDLWISINGIDSWDANPWVWAIQFKRVEAQTA